MRYGYNKFYHSKYGIKAYINFMYTFLVTKYNNEHNFWLDVIVLCVKYLNGLQFSGQSIQRKINVWNNIWINNNNPTTAYKLNRLDISTKQCVKLVYYTFGWRCICMFVFIIIKHCVTIPNWTPLSSMQMFITESPNNEIYYFSKRNVSKLFTFMESIVRFFWFISHEISKVRQHFVISWCSLLIGLFWNGK